MLNLITNTNNKKKIFYFISTCIFIYICLTPSFLYYLFQTILGRIVMLVFIIGITSYNTFAGIIISLILIGLYNTKVFESFTSSSSLPSSSSSSSDFTTNTNLIPKKKPVPVPGNLPINNINPQTVNSNIINNPSVEKSLPAKIPINESFTSYNSSKINNNKINRTKLLTMEDYMRPKSSNSLIISKNYKLIKENPISNMSGKEGFQSLNSLLHT